MQAVIEKLNKSFQKPKVVDVKSGDTVRVHQKIREGNKERVQVFQGLVIKTSGRGGHLSRITVRRISSGVGVEKSFLLHSPLVVRVEVTKRSKVRRNYLSYMRERTGKAARLSGVDFDRQSVNAIPEPVKEEAKTEEPGAEESNESEAQTSAAVEKADKPAKDQAKEEVTAEKEKPAA